MKTIVLANQKGGVAKTTTSNALITALHNRGNKVIGIDLDPQGNLSSFFGINSDTKPTIYNVLKRECDISEVIISIKKDCDIVPANVLLSGADQELTRTGKEYRLKEALETIQGNYDYAIVDTPPSLSVLTTNAFAACNEIIIPAIAEKFAIEGIVQLYNAIEDVKKYCNRELVINGILLTKFNSRTNIHKEYKEVTEEIAKQLEIYIYKTTIRNAVAIAEAQANETDIFAYSKNSTVAQDYNNFVEEYLKMN